MGARRRRALGLSGVALCAWCGWASGFHRSTTPARLTWSLSLLAVVVVDLLLWQGARGRRPGLRLLPGSRTTRAATAPGGRRAVRAVMPWLGLALVVGGWEALGIDTGPHQPHLTISSLTEAYRSLNAAALFTWMLAGFLYGVARARSAGPESGTAATAGGQATGGAAAAAWLRPASSGLLLPASRPAGVAFWIGVVATGGVIEAVARRSDGRLATAGDVIRLLTTPVAGRLIVVLAWAYAGFHLFAH